MHRFRVYRTKMGWKIRESFRIFRVKEMVTYEPKTRTRIDSPGDKTKNLRLLIYGRKMIS